MKTVLNKGVINALAASGGNLFTDSVTLDYKIVADKTADPLSLILPISIKPKTVQNIRYIDSAAEVRRAWTIGVEDTETIVAAIKYNLEIDYAQYKKESTRRGSQKNYGFTSAAVLTSAAVDRQNVYTGLNTKINNDAGNYISSALIHKVAFTGGTSVGDATETLVLGELATQGTSLATAKVVKLEITSGTLAGDDGAGFIWLHTVTGTWSASSLPTTFAVSTSVTITTAALLTEGQGLFLEDDAGYWVTPNLSRSGFSTVFATNGFSATSPYIARDGVYAQGIGSEMLLHLPVYNYLGNDIITGDQEYTFNQSPDSVKVYTQAIIDISDHPEPQAGQGTYENQSVQYLLYLDESNGTNLTNLKNALDAIVGL